MGLKYGETRYENYKINRKWSDGFVPQIKGILIDNARYIIDIRESDFDEDTQQATDMVITVNGGKVAVRVRRGKKYDDWTVRCQVGRSLNTELLKLRSGWCRWYLYCWSVGNVIKDWMLIDLDKVREKNVLDIKRASIPNGDGTYFIAISRKYLKMHGCIISEC